MVQRGFVHVVFWKFQIPQEFQLPIPKYVSIFCYTTNSFHQTLSARGIVSTTVQHLKEDLPHKNSIFAHFEYPDILELCKKCHVPQLWRQGSGFVVANKFPKPIKAHDLAWWIRHHWSSSISLQRLNALMNCSVCISPLFYTSINSGFSPIMVKNT